MTYFELTTQLQNMLDQGKDLEALDLYFHPDLIAIEKPTAEQRKGIDAQKVVVEQWYDMVDTFHSAGTKSLTVNENSGVSMVETWAEVTMKGTTEPVRMEEVVIYEWEGEKVKQMTFYYHNPMVGGNLS